MLRIPALTWRFMLSLCLVLVPLHARHILLPSPGDNACQVRALNIPWDDLLNGIHADYLSVTWNQKEATISSLLPVSEKITAASYVNEYEALIAGKSGTVVLYNFHRHTSLPLLHHPGGVRCIATRDTLHAILASNNNLFEHFYVLYLYDTSTSSYTCITHGKELQCVSWLNEGQLALSAKHSKIVEIFDLEAQAPLQGFKLKDQITALQCSPDGKFIAAGHASGDITIINSANGLQKTIHVPMHRRLHLCIEHLARRFPQYAEDAGMIAQLSNHYIEKRGALSSLLLTRDNFLSEKEQASRIKAFTLDERICEIEQEMYQLKLKIKQIKFKRNSMLEAYQDDGLVRDTQKSIFEQRVTTIFWHPTTSQLIYGTARGHVILWEGINDKLPRKLSEEEEIADEQAAIAARHFPTVPRLSFLHVQDDDPETDSLLSQRNSARSSGSLSTPSSGRSLRSRASAEYSPLCSPRNPNTLPTPRVQTLSARAHHHRIFTPRDERERRLSYSAR